MEIRGCRNNNIYISVQCPTQTDFFFFLHSFDKRTTTETPKIKDNECWSIIYTQPATRAHQKTFDITQSSN